MVDGQRALPQGMVTASWLMHLWAWQWFDGEFGPQPDLTVKTMIFLYMQDFFGRPCRIKDIGKGVGMIDGRTIRKVIDGLKYGGYVIEETGRKDKRQKVLFPTALMRRRVADELRRLLSNLSESIA